MFFGSKYVYKYDHSSSESLSEDEDVEESFVTVNKEAAIREESVAPSAASGSSKRRKKRLRKADTNVLSVRFDQLLQPGEMHAGDPVYCTDCGAIASHLSKIEHAENEGTKWHCDFCPKENTVDIEQNDLPKKEDATYLVSPAPLVHGSDITGVDDSIVIFLIDVSGSMSSTTLVPGTFEMPNALRQRERDTANFDGAHIPRHRHQTYVSRLQGVQMAVDVNLDKLFKDTPTRRAALLTFNHEITYYGDGTRTEPLVIRGDKLNNADDIIREAKQEQSKELKAVSETKKILTDRVYDVEEGGQTALGPAVLFALHIASQRQGSKVVICTDGLANRGLGNLEVAQDDKADEAVRNAALSEGNHFYADLTVYAKEKGVSVSIITISGTNCLLPVIGQMADGTNGNVTIVDLLKIRDEFASVLEQKVIATNVEATLLVHRGLYIRDPDNPDGKLERIKRDIGNATKHTEVTFEFGVRNKQELKDKFNIDLDELSQMPFQVQVSYVAADGSKALRVLTQTKETTSNREIAEMNAFRSVIAENHIQSTAARVMMSYEDGDDDDEEAEGRVSSKWSKPIMQKQRLAYMANLNMKKRSGGEKAVDQFNERRWKKASEQLNDQVVSSRAKYKKEARSKDESSSGTSIFGRISRMVAGSSHQSPDEAAAPAPQPSSESSKRSFGFKTTRLGLFSDKSSEDLYKFKKISSEYMREASPTREEEEEEPSATNTDPSSVIRDEENESNKGATSKPPKKESGSKKK